MQVAAQRNQLGVIGAQVLDRGHEIARQITH
jgi:hypothetical protein